MTKICSTCKISKPPSEFYAQPGNRDGLAARCKECAKRSVRNNRKARLEYYQSYERGRAKRPDRVQARKDYIAANPYPRPERDPQKKAARRSLGNAIRDGKIQRPSICDICAAEDKDLHGHHDDYSKPFFVIWCCVACHSLIHAYWRAQKRLLQKEAA